MDVAEYGVRGKGGDFEPLISEDLFYRVQSVLSGRMPNLMSLSSLEEVFKHDAKAARAPWISLYGDWSTARRVDAA
jgi:hypothetical protein